MARSDIKEVCERLGRKNALLKMLLRKYRTKKAALWKAADKAP